MEVKTSNREIDLMEVLVKLLDFVRANLFLAIFLPIAGALAGLGFSFIAGNRSESQMMIVTHRLTEPQCEFLLQQLEKTHSFPEVTEAQRRGLISLSHKIIEQPAGYTIVSSNDQPYIHVQISLRVKHSELRKVFETSIIKYLESSQPAIRKKEQLLEFYRTMIAQIDHELVALQELKTAISQNKGISLSAGDVYTQTIELAEKKIKYEQEAKSIEAFQLVKGFDGMSKNKQASPFRYSSAGFFSGICLLIIVLFLKYFATYYRQYHQKPTS